MVKSVMIPKIIHYCWFGRYPYPPLLEMCITSWKQHMPGYELLLWDEDRFDIDSSPLFVQQAYKAGKFAFVSDYVRMYALFNHGGIYLDTDVEVVKSFDELLENDLFFGFENKHLINSGLGCGSIANHRFIKEIMGQYENIEFIKSDGTFDLTPCPHRETKVALNHGLILNNKTQVIDKMIFLSSKFLNPSKRIYGFVGNKYLSRHHNYASWIDNESRIKNIENERKNHEDFLKYKRIFGLKLGYFIYKLAKFLTF